jgi:glutathione S-transferase
MQNPTLELVSHHLCPYVQRAVITLTEKAIAHKRTYIDLADKPGWFKAISPLGKVPLLRIDDSVVLFESAVICEYLDEITPGSLHPADPLEKARHRAWIEFGSSILDTIAGFYNAKDEAGFDGKRRQLIDKFQWLERHLVDQPYFAGRDFSLVDAVYGPLFRYFDVFGTLADFGFFAGTPRISAWRAQLRARPSVQQAVMADYAQRLLNFLERRDSRLAALIAQSQSPAAAAVAG